MQISWRTRPVNVLKYRVGVGRTTSLRVNLKRRICSPRISFGRLSQRWSRMLEQVGVGHLDTSVRSYRRATVQNGWVRSFIILVEFGFSSNTLKAESSEWSGKLDLRHSKEDGDAQHRPELDDDSETLTSGESESPEAHRAQVILFEQ